MILSISEMGLVKDLFALSKKSSGMKLRYYWLPPQLLLNITLELDSKNWIEHFQLDENANLGSSGNGGANPTSSRADDE